MGDTIKCTSCRNVTSDMVVKSELRIRSYAQGHSAIEEAVDDAVRRGQLHILASRNGLACSACGSVDWEAAGSSVRGQPKWEHCSRHGIMERYCEKHGCWEIEVNGKWMEHDDAGLPYDGMIERCRAHGVDERYCAKHGRWEIEVDGEWVDHNST